MDWLDAMDVACVLMARELCVHEPHSNAPRTVASELSPSEMEAVIAGALAVVAVGGTVGETAERSGIKLVRIDQPAWNVPVGRVVDALTPVLGLDVDPEPTISGCLMVRNEMKLLPDTIECARRCCDEIVVVDTGSTDGTREWLGRQDDLVVLDYDVGPEIQSFSDVRNHGILNSTGKYVIWLDAPDRLRCPEGLREIIRAETDDGYVLHSDFEWGGFVRREKIVLRAFAWFEDRVHEFIQLGGLKTRLLPPEFGIDRVLSVKVGREHSFKRNTRLLGMMLDENPEDHPRRDRWLFYMGLEYFQEGMFEEALPWMYKRLEHGGWDEETFGCLVSLGQVLLYYKYDYRQAREVAALLRDLRPACRDWMYLMAEAYRLEGAERQALEWYRMVAKAKETPCTTWCWAEAYGPSTQQRINELLRKTGS